jgi:DNA-directed RNA polymerase sigma subunit (sigma70/sigma32)
LRRFEIDAVVRALKNGILTEQERNVLMCRYGLWGQDQLSLKKTATKLSMSGEGVRGVETRALRKLRNYLVCRDIS